MFDPRVPYYPVPEDPYVPVVGALEFRSLIELKEGLNEADPGVAVEADVDPKPAEVGLVDPKAPPALLGLLSYLLKYSMYSLVLVIVFWDSSFFICRV